MDIERLQKQYASMIISAVNLQKGQNVVISGEACHWPFINTLAEAAYSHGAKYVEVQSSHSGLLTARATYSEEKYLDYAPPTMAAKQAIYIKERWARVAISSQENPDALSHIDDTKNTKMQTAARRAQTEYRQAVMSDKINWLVCAAPTPGWAAKVLNGKPTPKNVLRLWRELAPILRLDQPDPLEALHNHCLALNTRAEKLTQCKIRVLHFTAPGTDLKVYLHPLARWKGGYSSTPKGIRFLPNFPTEEVFTTPDCRLTEGRVRLSRPAIILEKIVEGAEIEFRKGRVVKVHAERGQEALENFLKSDAGASQLGEIALVDCSSPIYRSHLVFHNILLDENAACHCAFGAAYPSCIAGGVAMKEAERKKVGINQSVVHNDVMIGSDKLNVTATTHEGRERPIIERGAFCDL